jgi:hypothetical protein
MCGARQRSITIIFKQKQKKLNSVLTILIALIMGSFSVIPKVFATTYLTKPSVILTNMNASGSSSVILEFTTSSSNTGTALSVSFTGWTGGSAGAVNATQSVSNSFGSLNCTAITGASADLPGSPAATGSGATVTFSGITAMSASTSYCVVLSSTTAVTNPTATGVQSAVITAGSDAAATVSIDIISNDQVVVTATVPSSFTLALSGSTDAFTANLASGSIGTTTGVTATVNTNAKNGWYLFGTDANTGIRSTTQSYTIASKTPGTNASLTAGTEGYVTGLPASGITQGTGAGTTSATTAYASSGSGNGSGLDTNYRQIASSTGTASGAIVTIKEYAAISAITPAATDYSDTITLVGAGSF